MSLNLTVPKDSPTTKERAKIHRRAKSPMGRHHPRAKSKSPNPSFCSVLSRVKDWELGAFTPKTALADNVDVMNRSNVPFSDSGHSQKDSGSEPSPLGSPLPEESKEDQSKNVKKDALTKSSTGGKAGDQPQATGGSALIKSALNSNLSKSPVILHYFVSY